MSQEQQQEKGTAATSTSDGLAETGGNEGIRSSDALRRIFSERDQRKKLREKGVKLMGDFPVSEDQRKTIYSEAREAAIQAARPDPSVSIKHDLYTTGAAASSFTSTRMNLAYDNEYREMTDLEKRTILYDKVRKAHKKGYAAITLDHGGTLNLELHCDIAPQACDNFIRLCKSGYYNGVKFHRVIRNFMMQGGDPEGTGRGGKSAFEGGAPFRDEFDSRLTHTGAGGAALDALNETETDRKERPIEPIKIIKTQVFVNPFETILDDEAAQKKEEEDKLKEAQLLRDSMDVMKNHPKRSSTGIGKYLSTSHKRKSHAAASPEEASGAVLGQMGKSKRHKAFESTAEYPAEDHRHHHPMDTSLARLESQAAYTNMSNSDRAKSWAKSYFSHAWKKIKLEWEVLKVAWPWIIIGIIFQILHDWAHNWIYYLSGKMPWLTSGIWPFPDIDTLTVSVAPENPVLVACMVIAIVFAVLAPTFGGRDDFTLIGVIWRVLNVCDFTIIFRCISFLVTILPAPAPHCQEAPPPNAPWEPYFNPPTDADAIFSGFDVQNGCGDLVFSSHMMYCLLATLVVTHYSRSLVLMVIEWLLCCALVCLILAQRSHYTLDVWVSWYTTPMVWICFYHFFPNDPMKYVAFWQEQPKRVYIPRDKVVPKDERVPTSFGTPDGSHLARNRPEFDEGMRR
ncbi:peptidylprolyl [Perkinsus olseni]|uniref:Peptidylprolyl n=1 Tax=Perkinsus olseni TaxID=32597 RepID=A0A7J6NRV1_PEROL|nr:peptidylprolyl [Perkinsus olseni]